MKMKQKLLPRILISLLGVAFILWGSMSAALGIFGEETTAVITHIRREGGERTDIKPNRYTYNISYNFALPNGMQVDGVYKKIDNAVYIKVDGTGETKVRYLKIMPRVNATEESLRHPLKQVVLMSVGIILLILINQNKSNTKSKLSKEQ